MSDAPFLMRRATLIDDTARSGRLQRHPGPRASALGVGVTAGTSRCSMIKVVIRVKLGWSLGLIDGFADAVWSLSSRPRESMLHRRLEGISSSACRLVGSAKTGTQRLPRFISAATRHVLHELLVAPANRVHLCATHQIKQWTPNHSKRKGR